MGGVTHLVQDLLEVEQGASTTGTSHVLDHGFAQSQGLQDRVTDGNFLLRRFGERHPQRIPETTREKACNTSGALDPAVVAVTGFRHTEVEWIVEAFPIHRVSHQPVGRQHYGSA